MPPLDTIYRTRIFTLIDLPKLSAQARRARYMREVYRKTHIDLTVSIPKQQYDEVLLPHAVNAGRKVRAFVREAAFAYIGQSFLVPRDLEAALLAVTDQLAALGNNLNQIARHANLEQTASRQDVQDARRLLERAEQLVEEAVRFPERG